MLKNWFKRAAIAGFQKLLFTGISFIYFA